MKHTRTHLAIAAILVLVTACLCGCSSINLTPTSVDAAIQKQQSSRTASVTAPTIATAGTLTVGLKTSGASAPFEIVDSATDEATGVDIDLACAIADQLGLSVRFVSVTDAKTALAKGCDIVMDVKTGEATDVTVVGNYAETAAALFRRGSLSTVSSTDLAGKSVALQKGSTSQKTLSRANLTMTQKEYSNLNESFEALEAGTVDYVVCDAYPGGYLAATFNDISFCGTLDAPTEIGIGVSSSNSALQQAIQGAYEKVAGNGVYGLIRTKWIGSLPTLTTSTQVQGVTLTDATATEAGTSETATSTTSGDGSGAGSNAATV